MVQLIKLLISSADTKLKNQLADALLRNGKQRVEIQLDAVATVFDVRELRHRCVVVFIRPTIVPVLTRQDTKEAL
ncbi:MAG: hypothetical protein IKI00_06055 [Bacteroidales bacterium]|nr:hypothetical protein [Bacteroidales bacterium]